MQSRRTFLSRLAALPFVGVLLGTINPAESRVPIDVTGKPTPLHLQRGVTGSTYFRAPTKEIVTCLLNGVDVSMRASECDTHFGWVRMFDVDAKDCIVVHGEHAIERIHFGKVEVR